VIFFVLFPAGIGTLLILWIILSIASAGEPKPDGSVRITVVRERQIASKDIVRRHGKDWYIAPDGHFHPIDASAPRTERVVVPQVLKPGTFVIVGGRKQLPDGTYTFTEPTWPAQVYGGQLHAFMSWPGYFAAGGPVDLNRATYFDYLDAGWFGEPVVG
jgi:hypothetical protein